MQQTTILILCILSLLGGIQGASTRACSLYCSSCDSFAQYYTCNSCPDNVDFYSTGPGDNLSPNCTVDDEFNQVYQLLNNQFPLLTSTDNCGFFEGSGKYSMNQTLQLWSAATTVSIHYKIRVMVEILFIDRWTRDSNSRTTSRRITINTDGYEDKFFYTNASSVDSNQCGDPRFERLYRTSREMTHKNLNFDINITASQCYYPSQCQWLIVDAILIIKVCNEACSICSGPTNGTCTECNAGFLLSGTTCHDQCLDTYYELTNETGKCAKCNTTCLHCAGVPNNCTVCKMSYILFPNGTNNASCLVKCPNMYFNYTDADTNQSLCTICDPSCSLCTGSPSPCQSCNPNYFLYNYECLVECPSPLVKDINTWKCQNCSTFCVNMTLSQFNPSGGTGLSPLSFDLNFTFPIDWVTFDKSIFQKITFGGSLYNISNFNVSFKETSSRTYRVTINPIKYAFIINQSVTIKVRERPTDINYTSTDFRPFMDDVFNQTTTVVWTYIKPPDMTDTEYTIVSTMSSLSTAINNGLSGAGIQELKKFGFVLLVLNSLQITSCLLLLHTILPQNLYQGIRFFASLVFFDVPPWEAQSTASRYLVYVPIKSLSNKRLLTDQVDEFYFRRTGFSGVFVFDAYSQIFLIIGCYLALGISVLVSSRCKRARRARALCQSALDGFHEIAVMYFTLTIVFEFTYFDGSGVKWISIIACFLVNIYYLMYQLKVYYSLLEYPTISLHEPRFQEFITKYSYYLKNIRFDKQHIQSGEWGIFKQWFRPHNYHILSYAKKFMMMLAFPLFYRFGYAQISVLIAIQSFQILRFIFTWPYTKKWRNIARLVLEGILLAIFVLILFIQLIIVYLTSGSSDNTQTWASLFFAIGWITFALVYAFNLGYLVMFCVNWFQNCNQSNRQILEQSREDYYFNLLKEHQQGNQQVPMPILNEWVKKGNLNKRNLKSLPEISYRIQYYNICKVEGNYQLQIKTITKLAMTTEFNFKMADNNLEPLEVVETTIIIHPMSDIFNTFSSIYNNYATSSSGNVTVKTFLDVDQNKFKFSNVVPMPYSSMKQEICVHDSESIEPHLIRHPGLLPGFPIPYDLLLKGINMAEKSSTKPY